MRGESVKGHVVGSLNGKESGEAFNPADGKYARYSCSCGQVFEVRLYARAEVPESWECRCGRTAVGSGNPVEERRTRSGRTPWDMLMERRTIPELEELLAERLAILRGKA